MLDFTFFKLGLDQDSAIDHPIVMTEIPCNVNRSRTRASGRSWVFHSCPFLYVMPCPKGMSELMFELYRVPSVTYGIDSLFSLYHNRRSQGCLGGDLGSGNRISQLAPFPPLP